MPDGLTITGTLENLSYRHDGAVYATITHPEYRHACLFHPQMVTAHADLIWSGRPVTVTGDASNETLRVETVEVLA